MIKNMLSAASKMMKDSKDEKVVCAKIIIDEIVAGMEPQTMVLADSLDPILEIKPKTGKKSPASSPENKGKIMVDKGKITSIEGVDLETTMIDLDGKVMTCAEAIGKSFQNGKFV